MMFLYRVGSRSPTSLNLAGQILLYLHIQQIFMKIKNLLFYFY